jgi:hypothetical protein
MTIQEFKNIARSENFHYEGIYGIHYFRYGLHIYRSIEKLTGEASETYFEEVMNVKRPISKEKFINQLN